MRALSVVHACVLAGVCLPLGAWAGDVAFSLRGGGGQPAADAVVSLVPLAGKPELAPPSKPLAIEQRNQEFVPFVTAVVAGTTVELPNNDEVEHHVYSLSPSLQFDKPLYRPGTHESLRFERPGVVVMGCNIHDWMIGYVVVLETPWFAVTGEGGGAAIANVPPGRYRAEIWHPRLVTTVTREIDVGNAPISVDLALALRPDRRIRRPEAPSRGY